MKKLSRDGKETLIAWILLAPSIFFLSIFTVFPILRSIYLSFHQLELGMRAPEFIGLKNYLRLAKSDLFWKVMGNSFYFAFLTVVPSIIIGLLLAIVLNKKFKGIGVLRTAFFYPVVMPMIAIASIWTFIYMPDAGLFAQVLKYFGLKSVNLLSGINTVLPAMAFMYVWKEAGYLMIFFLSGLQNISEELYEAARIDGANGVLIFFKITVPLLMPTTLFVSTIALTNCFKLVDHVVIMTEGMPNNSSTLLLYYIYQNGFTFFDQGVASALTVIMLGIMLAIAMFQFIKADSRIHYN